MPPKPDPKAQAMEIVRQWGREGGQKATGDKKKRSKAHYARLAKMKKEAARARK